MKIGISRPSHSEAESREVLSCARRFGFEGVQLKPAQYNAFLSDPEAFSRHYGDLAGLAAGGLIFYPGGNPAEWEGLLQPAIAFASAVNADHICICSCVYQTGASNEEVQAVVHALAAVGRNASAQGLRISIHNHASSIVESEEDVARVLDKLDPEVCGLTFDTAHAAKGGVTDFTSTIRRFKNHLINVHLKDLGGDGKFCPLGQGTLNLDPIFDALREIDYKQWLIVDEESPGVTTPEAMEIARQYLRDRNIMY